MDKKVTKKQIVEFVKAKLANDEKWAKHALLKIYSYQTAEEQQMETTSEYNNVGFNGADAEILSSIAKQFERKGWISSKQMVIVFKKIKKYSRQIIEISDEVKLLELVKTSAV
jgi:hypothetical protein